MMPPSTAYVPSGATHRLLLAVVISAAVWFPSTSSRADVVVLANRAAVPAKLRVATAAGTAWEKTLAPGETCALPARGQLELTFSAGQAAPVTQTLVPNRAYFLTGNDVQLELHPLQFGSAPSAPGIAVEPVRAPDPKLAAGVLPVTVLLDAREPETQLVWEPRLRRRLEDASEILESHLGVRLEIVELGIWKPTLALAAFPEALRDFQQHVPANAARLVIGFTRQYSLPPDGYAQSGGLSAPLGTHLLVPDSSGQIKADQALRMLLHELGHFWGAVHGSDPNSLMRVQLATAARGPLTYDPASALVMGLVAEEVRTRGVNRLAELSPARKRHLNGIYTAVAGDRFDPTIGQTAALLGLPQNTPEPGPAPGGAPAKNDPSLTDEISLVEITVPDIPGGYAIWNGTTRDAQGRLWFAVSSTGVPGASAHLFEVDTAGKKALVRGDVVSALRMANKLRQGESQGLMLCPMTPGPDGQLYFASVGEDQAQPDASRPPKWGSHVWRIRLPERRWEHLAAVPEGLVSLVARGEYLYALGYPGHRLYQVHLPTGRMLKVEVGSQDGHICRTLVADAQGHVFVPRVRLAADPIPTIRATLVAWDDQLRELGQTPLEHYGGGPPQICTGIVGQWTGPDGLIVFVTQVGAVYQLRARENAGPEVQLLTQLDPAAQTQIESVGADTTGRTLVAAARQTIGGKTSVVWITCDLAVQRALVHALPEAEGLKNLGFSGPVATDSAGLCYLAGTYHRGALRVAPAVIEFLQQRGYLESQRAQLQANAQRTHQPLLFAVRPGQ